MHLPLLSSIFLYTLTTAATSNSTDFASQCYAISLPTLTTSTANRTIPWGTPSLTLSNGTTCCDSLTQIRAGINDIDDQLLNLLALRAGYVREATRFKATLSTVDVPARDAEVIQNAINAANSTIPPLPASIAQGVFEAILNASVPFEECVFEEYLSSGMKKRV